MARLAGSISAGVLILCGAINALLSKVVYQLQGQDCSGATKPFQKPWLQTALMFIAMAACLPIAFALEAWEHRKKQQQQQRQQHREYPAASGEDLETTAGSLEPSEVDPPLKQNESKTKKRFVGIAARLTGSSSSSSSGGGRVGRGEGDLQQPLLAAAQQRVLQQQQQQQQQGYTRLQQALLLCIPTGFDLAATTLMNVGLLYIAASVFQILRGAEMVFAALFAVLFLKRHLNRWHYLGVGLCMAGISLVGVSRVLAGGDSGGTADSLMMTNDSSSSSSSSGDPKQALLGMCLILLSQALQAGQVTVEDHFMSQLDMAPLQVVGWEGVIGSSVMAAGLLPLLQWLPFADGSGLAEDTAGSWCMVRSSGAITAVLLLSSFAVLLYNISGMYVTEEVGAAARTVLENARTLIVWLAALALYYTHIGSGGGGGPDQQPSIGEPWDSWSWLQALGFAVFAAGALLYDKGHQQEEAETIAAGKVPVYSKWAVLKSTLNIKTGHFVGIRAFRAAGNAVIAGLRINHMAELEEEQHAEQRA